MEDEARSKRQRMKNGPAGSSSNNLISSSGSIVSQSSQQVSQASQLRSSFASRSNF